MLSRVATAAISKVVKPKPTMVASYSSHAADAHEAVAKEHFDYAPNREVVGFGTTGEPAYMDSFMFPYPSIRFKAITKELEPLKLKEKGDWKNLTIEEKKTLYRASFCQTFAEMDAPTGEWKGAFGISFTIIAISLMSYVLMHAVGIFPDRPETLTEEGRQALLQKMIDLRWNPITGTASKWDYEKNDWKK